MSSAYAHKMKVRQERTNERLALKEAKKHYRQQVVNQLMANGVEEQVVDSIFEEMAKKDRSKITQIKKDFLTEETF